MLKYKKMLCITLGFVSCAPVWADICPPPPSSVSPALSVSTSYNKKTKLYEYRYTLRNQPNAQIPLNSFGLLMNQAPPSFLSAANWNGRYNSLNSSPYQLRWSTISVAPSEANMVSGDGTLSAPIYAIQPGKSVGGFEVSSAQPPGIVQYFAQGFTQIASGIPTVNNDEPEPSCAGWDFDNPLIETQVTGATIGPSDPSILSIRIRAREESGLHPGLPISPKNPSGKISVLILSADSFDASEINVASIVFGPAYVSPLTSKLVPAGQGEQLGFDERADWEKLLETLQPGSADRKNAHPKNLLLTFEVSALDVQCNIDQALFLRGKTTSGQQFIGEVSSNTAGCGPQEIGRHKHHPFPFQWWLPQTVSH